MRRYIFILSIVLALSACDHEVEQSARPVLHVCADGRLTADISDCADDYAVPEPSVSGIAPAPELSEVASTTAVRSSTDIKSAFRSYANGLGYEYISSEHLKTEDGVDFYKVVYRHSELGGGIREIVIDSNGKVYEAYAIA